MGIKINILSVLFVVMSFAAQTSYAQKHGSPEPKENALNYRYQTPSRRAVRFSEHRSFLERSYVSVGMGTERIWGLSELIGNSTLGVNSRLSWGYWASPVHGIELGTSWGVLPYAEWEIDRKGKDYCVPSFVKYAGVELNYMFNLTNFAFGRENVSRWNLTWLAGVDMKYSGETSWGANTALRISYSPSPNLGIYIEPKVSAFDNHLDSEKQNNLKAHVTPALTAGVILRLNDSKRGKRFRYYDQEPSLQSEYNYDPKVAVKTNLLFLAAGTPNISLEIPIGNQFSLNGDYLFPWFRNRVAGFTYQLITGNLEGRFWFDKRTKLQGHFVGIYAGAGYYDLQYRQNGYQGEFYITTGVSYGYVKPIANNLAIEFSLGLGYLQTNYKEYYPDEGCLVYKATTSTSLFGPTKVAIGLVWSIGKGGRK